MEKKDHVLLGAALTVGAVEGWLDEHVDPETGYVVDDTLAIEGAAADSKATGEAIAAVEAEIPAVDATLATTGAAADAKKVGDEISDLKSAMETKAEQDGSYDSMTVGNAEQLVSTVGVDDKTPYLFRTTGGSADVGDRVKLSEITGGTVAWNQLVQNGNFANTDNWRPYNSSKASLSVANGIASVTCLQSANNYSVGLFQELAENTIITHKLLVSCDIKVPRTGGWGFDLAGTSAGSNKQVTTTDWTNLSFIKIANNATKAFIVGPAGTTLEANDVFQIKNVQVFDLTLLFGSTIADYIYSLETATAGAGVAFFRNLFPAPYYSYDAGSLISVKTTGHKEVGFNQWDEEWEQGYYNTTTGAKTESSSNIRCKNRIPVIPNTTYYFRWTPVSNEVVNYQSYDADGSFIKNDYLTVPHTFTTPSDCHYITFYFSSAYGNTYHNDICINLHWDGERDGEYEPYEEHSYPLDDVELRGIPKLDANNLYYDGDSYEADGTVTRKYGIVDLGTLDYTRTTHATLGISFFYTTFNPAAGADVTAKANAATPKYMLVRYSGQDSLFDIDKTFAIENTTHMIYIRDDSYTDAATFKTAMSGVYLVYELATPTTESADPYQETQICNDFGTEEFIDTRTVPIPVGTVSRYQANLRAKLEMAPDSPADGDGDYIVRQTNGENAYVKLVIPTELPTSPTTDGSYHLKCTVASGTATLSWESDS